MRTEPPDIDLATLAEKTGISARTVRYYIHQGLLPSPGKGPNARYDASLIDRLRLIKEYQEQHLPLSEIRKRLEELDEEGIRAALGKPLELPLSASALSYVRKLIGSPPQAPGDRVEESLVIMSRYSTRATSPEQDLFSSPLALPAERSGAGPRTLPDAQSASGPSTWQIKRSTWEHVRLTRNIELNVRRPLTREENKLLDQLLDAARKIFSEEP